MAAAVFGMRMLLAPLGVHALPLLIMEVATGAAVYIGWIIQFDRRGLGEIRQVMLDLGISEQRLARWPFNRAVHPSIQMKP